MIEAVDLVALEQLDDGDALADGFETACEMRRLLAELYPLHASDDKQWFRVKFRLHELHIRARKVHQDTASLI